MLPMRNGSGPRRPQPPISRPLYVARRALKLTKVEVGKALGIGPRSIREWELGTRRPSRKNLERFIVYIEKLDANVGARLRLGATGKELPKPEPPSIDRVIAGLAGRRCGIADRHRRWRGCGPGGRHGNEVDRLHADAHHHR